MNTTAPTPGSRVTHARKSRRSEPAKLVKSESTGAGPESESFNPKVEAERLNVWRLNSKGATYYAPTKSRSDVREMSGADVRRFLASNGIRTRHLQGQLISDAEEIIEYVCNYRLVDFAGPLAGYKAGVYFNPEGVAFIVTGGPRLIPPKKGDWSLIKQIIEPRFKDDDEPLHLDYFLLWLKRGIEPLYKNRRRKGLILIMVGENDSGKSFLQHFLITPLLGGRETDPTTYFKSEQGFNRDVMSSEHLAIGEFAFPLDDQSRLMLAEKMKKLVGNESQPYHCKGRDSITAMPPHHRLSVSVNNEPQKLKALPQMTADMADKVLLLKVRLVEMPMPTNTDIEQALFVDAVRRQLPAFAYHLLHEYEPPAEIAKGRFGMAHYMHPEIADVLFEQERVARFQFNLDDALKGCFETSGAWGWDSAQSLHEYLCEEAQAKHGLFRSLLKNAGSCAQYLGILRSRETDQVARALGCKPSDIKEEDSGRRYLRKHTNRGNLWLIKPPLVPDSD